LTSPFIGFVGSEMEGGAGVKGKTQKKCSQEGTSAPRRHDFKNVQDIIIAECHKTRKKEGKDSRKGTEKGRLCRARPRATSASPRNKATKLPRGTARKKKREGNQSARAVKKRSSSSRSASKKHYTPPRTERHLKK